MLYMKTIAVFSEVPTKRINRLWAECRMLNVKTGGIYSNRQAFERLIISTISYMFRLCYAILRLCITIQDQKVQMKNVIKNRDFSYCHICYVHTLQSDSGTNIYKKPSPAKMACHITPHSFAVVD
jgi:hypothetical protein